MAKKKQDGEVVEITNLTTEETIKGDVQNADISAAEFNIKSGIQIIKPDWDLYYEEKLAKNAQINSRSLQLPAMNTEAERLGVDSLANFTLWALDVSAHIKESLKDGKFSLGEKAMMVVKIFGGIGNLSPDSVKKISRELADLTDDEKKYISNIVIQKFPVPNFDKALEIASDVVVIIEKAIKIIDISSQF